MNETTIAAFPGNYRMHVGITVGNLERSKEFYKVLFDQEPTKERVGYAKFEPHDPSLNLSLSESPGSSSPNSGLHFGIQVKSTDAVRQATERFQNAGLHARVQEQATCCYAVQDKVWITDPDGNQWEIFVVLENADSRYDDSSECCSNSQDKLQQAGSANCC